MISVSTGGVEDCAVQLQLTAELEGVAQVAIVGQGHFALPVVHFNGLTVGPGAAGHTGHSRPDLPQAGVSGCKRQKRRMLPVIDLCFLLLMMV